MVILPFLKWNMDTGLLTYLVTYLLITHRVEIIFYVRVPGLSKFVNKGYIAIMAITGMMDITASMAIASIQMTKANN